MKEKGDNFIPSVVLAVAAHALLFLAFAWLVARGNLVVVRPGITPVDVELIGGSSHAEGKGPGNGSAPGPRPPQPARVPAPSPQKRTPSPAAPAPPTPTPPSSPSTAAVPSPSSQTPRDAPQAQGMRPVGPPSAGNGAPGGEGSADAGQAGTGSGGNAGGLGASGPAGEVMADIDPVPIEPIDAPYPAIAKRLGQRGLTKVEADIDEKGIVVAARIAVSSGFASLDGAALDAVKKTRFMPAIKNGKAVESRYLIPIRFVLPQD